MKRYRVIFLVFLLGLFLGTHNNTVFSEGVLSEESFPLKKGSYWVYQGKVTWADDIESGQISQKVLKWKMEIIDVVSRDDVKVAILKGHPQDLTWYQEGDLPGDYLIVQKAKKYYLIMGNRMDNVLSRLEDQQDTLDNLVLEDELFLDMPLVVSKVFGPQEQINRPDLAYVWHVANQAKVDLEYINLLNIPAETIQYQLIFQTVPDNTYVDFVPGVGIVQYKYLHYGSVAEADFKLIEYFSG